MVLLLQSHLVLLLVDCDDLLLAFRSIFYLQVDFPIWTLLLLSLLPRVVVVDHVEHFLILYQELNAIALL